MKKIREIIEEKTDFRSLPEDNELIVMDEESLKDALKPLLKWQRSTSGYDEPFLNAAVLFPRGDKCCRLVATDHISTLTADVECESVNLKHPVAIDIRSLSSLLALSHGEVVLAGDGAAMALAFQGGWAYVPTYDLPPKNYAEKALEDFTKIEGSSSMVDTLLVTLSSLKKLAAGSHSDEDRMLYGRDDRVYACNGNVVAKSECFFVPATATVNDIEVVCAMLAVETPSSRAVSVVKKGNQFMVVSERYSFEFMGRTAKLDSRLVKVADANLKEFFFIDAQEFIKVTKAMASVKGYSGRVVLSVKKRKGGFYLEAGFPSLSGESSVYTITEDGQNIKEEFSLEVEKEHLTTVLALVSSSNMAKLRVSTKGIAVNSDSVSAAVVSGKER